MATIDYTRRSVRLGNLPTPQKAMAPILPDTMSGIDRTHATERGYARKAAAWDAIANGGAKIGQAALALDAMLQERENDRKVAKAAGMVMSIHDGNMTDPDAGEDGKPKGLLNRIGEDCRTLPEDGHRSLTDTVRAVSEELELNDTQVELLKGRLSPYAASCMGRLRTRRQAEIARIQLEDAAALWKTDVKSIADGNDTDGMYETALADFGKYLDLAGSRGKARELERDTFVRTLFKAGVARTVNGIESEAEMDAAIKAAEERPDSLFMGNEVLRREMGGTVGDDLKEEMLKGMRDARDRLVSRHRHERQLAAIDARDEAVQRELEAADKDMSPLEWVQEYRAWGRDPKLRAVSPETALKYMDAADRMERAVKKGEAQATENALADRMNRLTFLEIDGRADGKALAGEQAATWREFRTGMLAGKLSPDFVRTFQGRLQQRLTQEEQNAMREFYAAFGYRGDLNAEGEPGAKDRKDLAKTTFLAPVDETVPMTDEIEDGREVKGREMFELGDTLLRQLRTMGPEAYRPEVMRTVIGEIKARKMADDFAKNRDALAQKIFDIQRNLNAGELQNGRTDGTGKPRTDGGEEGGEAD